nr:hypothetical protein [Actinoplanes polyasparticus]
MQSYLTDVLAHKPDEQAVPNVEVRPGDGKPLLRRERPRYAGNA